MAETTVTRPRTYRDLNLTLGLNPVTNDVLALVGADAVRRAVKTLLLVNAGEVPFFPEFGTRLYRLLFEPMDAITTVLLEAEIRAVIDAYEPRAQIQTLVVTPDEEHNRYQLDFTFQVVNLASPVNLSVFLTRLR
jgi:phage baseplate assembly protein W